VRDARGLYRRSQRRSHVLFKIAERKLHSVIPKVISDELSLDGAGAADLAL
jgi:hypothetical protein